VPDGAQEVVATDRVVVACSAGAALRLLRGIPGLPASATELTVPVGAPIARFTLVARAPELSDEPVGSGLLVAPAGVAEPGEVAGPAGPDAAASSARAMRVVVPEAQAMVAAWALGDEGVDETGKAIAIDDPLADELLLLAAAQRSGHETAFISHEGVFGDLATNKRFRRTFVEGPGPPRRGGGCGAVHGDGVEGFVGDFLGHQLQNRLGHFGISGDKRQHGRHVRMNHARTFGDAGGADCVFFADQALARSGFRYSVRRHDGTRRVRPECRANLRQSGHDFIHRQRLQNHAGRKRHDLIGLAANLFRHGRAHFNRVQTALRTGTRIGIARIND